MHKDSTILWVTYTVTNLGRHPMKLALWENTRLPYTGNITVPYPGVEPTGPHAQAMVTVNDDYKMVYANILEEGKIFFKTSQTGQIYYEKNGYILVKEFQALNEAEVAPEQGNIELYIQPEKEFFEIESQSSFKTLAPKKSKSYTVKWIIIPAPFEE